MRDQGGEQSSQLTYFYDFIRIIEADYPHASLLVILGEIAFAREFGPALSRLAKEADVYRMTLHIGFGHKAVVELEYDRQGRLQPVMGGIIKD